MNELIMYMCCAGVLVCLYFIVVYIKEVHRQLKLLESWKIPGRATFYWMVSSTFHTDEEVAYHSYLALVYNQDKESIFTKGYQSRRSAIRGVFDFMDDQADDILNVYNQREIYFTDQLDLF